MLLNLSFLGTWCLFSAAAAKTINVDVGNAGLTFSPNTITADVGDEIAFDVYLPHSVVEGNGFDNPCAFKPGGFFSGFSSMEQTFTIKVTDTNPIWIYCSQVSHCQSGMVGVINPPASGPQTLAAYAAAAQKTTKSTDPGAQSGGVTPGGSSSSSASSSASSSSSASKSAAASSSVSSASAKESSAAASPSSAAATQSVPPSTNATASSTVSPPSPLQTTNSASSTFSTKTVMMKAFVGLIAIVAGWASFL